MAIDPAKQKIYVFGGKIIHSNPSYSAANSHSGLFVYDIAAKKWTSLR